MVHAARGKAKPRVVEFDPVLAALVAERLAQGLHPSLIAMQLGQRADPDLVAAYAREIESHPYFRGALVVADALKKRDWILDCQARSWRQSPDATVIDRREGLSPDVFLRDYYANQRPVVIGGLVDHWPALSLWSADYLEAKVGRDTLVEAQKGRASRKDFETAKLDLRRTVPFGEIAAALRSPVPSNDLYVTANNGANNRAAFDPIWRDFGPVAGYTTAAQGNDGYLWIGPAGTVTPFHHDLTNNLLIQVKGRKRVHMVPNWEEARMKQTGRIFSGWTLDELQKASASAGDKAPILIEAEIGPGDALFIPVGWWHHVVSLDESYSVLFTDFVWPNDFATPFMQGR
ncbi:MAG: cupin-like domain-containing protein [Pseudomonadota bacterium]